MFNLSTALIIITIATQIIMLFNLNSDNLLSKKSKLCFINIFSILMLISFIGWVSFYATTISDDYLILVQISIFLRNLLSLVIFILISVAFEDEYFLKKYYIAMFFTIIIAIITIIDFFFFDNSILIKVGDTSIAYIIIFMSCLINMIRIVIQASKKYQSNNISVILLVFASFISIYIVQFFISDFYIIYLVGTVGIVFVYTFYTSLFYRLDPLTTLLNRRCFNNRVFNYKNCVILFCDLNNFKELNDTYGHHFGDFILKEISKIVYKTFSHYGECYRLSGDEFCVILKVNLEKAKSLIEKFNQSLKIEKEKEPLLPTVAIGYGEYLKDKNTFEKALAMADTMMYREKEKFKKNNEAK